MRGPHLQIPTRIAPRVPHLWSLVKAFVIQPSYCLLYLSSWMLTSTQKVNSSMRPYFTKPEIIWGVVYWWWPPIFKFQLVSHPGSHTREAWWKHLWSNLATAFFFSRVKFWGDRSGQNWARMARVDRRDCGQKVCRCCSDVVVLWFFYMGLWWILSSNHHLKIITPEMISNYTRVVALSTSHPKQYFLFSGNGNTYYRTTCQSNSSNHLRWW